MFSTEEYAHYAVLTQCKNIMGLPEQAVEKDYQYMCDSIIYGEKPTSSEQIESIRELEQRFRERS